MHIAEYFEETFSVRMFFWLSWRSREFFVITYSYTHFYFFMQIIVPATISMVTIDETYLDESKWSIGVLGLRSKLKGLQCFEMKNFFSNCRNIHMYQAELNIDWFDFRFCQDLKKQKKHEFRFGPHQVFAKMKISIRYTDANLLRFWKNKKFMSSI